MAAHGQRHARAGTASRRGFLTGLAALVAPKPPAALFAPPVLIPLVPAPPTLCRCDNLHPTEAGQAVMLAAFLEWSRTNFELRSAA